MKMNNTLSIALMALLTLGTANALAASTDTGEMMKTDSMENMDGEMKKDGMEKMDEMKTEAMEKMDEMKDDGMEKMDGDMTKDHKKKAMMDG